MYFYYVFLLLVKMLVFMRKSIYFLSCFIVLLFLYRNVESCFIFIFFKEKNLKIENKVKKEAKI